MGKVIDEQLANLEREEQRINKGLARVEKHRNDLYGQLREIRKNRDRLNLMRFEGQPVKLKSGAARGPRPEFVAAMAQGAKLMKVNRTRADVEAGGKSWSVPIDLLQDPADGLKAGMIL